MIDLLTKKLVLLLIFIIILIVKPTSVVAYSYESQKQESQVSNNEALIAFTTAVSDANNRLQRFRQSKQAIALTQTSEDIKGNIFQRRFTPSSYDNNEIVGTWETLRADDEFNESITVSDDILFDSTNFDLDTVKLIRQTESTWVFQINNIINVDSEDDSVEQELERLDNVMTEHLFTEITVSKQFSQIKNMKIFAASEFKPSWLLTVRKFELRLAFNEAWPDGPIIRKSITRHVKGQYGWLMSIDELVTSELTGIEKVTLPDS